MSESGSRDKKYELREKKPKGAAGADERGLGEERRETQRNRSKAEGGGLIGERESRITGRVPGEGGSRQA